RARALEDRGDFVAAALEYEREGLPEEAIRVLLVSADADPDPAGRVRTLARALRLASQHGTPPQELRIRYARARLDVLRPTHLGTASVWELSTLARELEELEDYEAAAEAYGLAGDRGSQVRLLTAAGKIEELEGILASENERTRSGRIRTQFFKDLTALTSSGQRIEALRRARTFAELNPADEEVLAQLRSLQDRLPRPPIAHLEVEGIRVRYVLGPEVSLGRSGATIALPSPVLSRLHLLFHARHGIPTVEDLATRNGTFLAGARLAAPLPIRSPLSLELGGEVPCEVEPWGDAGLQLRLGGELYRLPLTFRASVGLWCLETSPGEEGFRLTVPPGAPIPILNGSFSAGDGLDLLFGDVLHRERGGEPVLRVLP
ncbi:MAG: FHA domain-containing protein, partial [Myxococcales bacterium]|nr:FHA domain-containing protein [Polyangiaceae bacterium]MDW8250091.1 FHA domain-containing protein [Myxococcales bacterium]